MPLQYYKYLQPDGELGIWRIEEDEDWFKQRVELSREEQAQLAPIKGHRRLEWWAARKLVHGMSGRAVRAVFSKDEHGKPHLPDSDWHISISHSRELAAAIAAPTSVGVDIQHIIPRIKRLAHKFLCQEEEAFVEQDHPTVVEQLHVIWGAKEAMYKAYGKRELDFSAHMRLEAFSYSGNSGKTSGCVEKGTQATRYQIHYEKHREHMLVYVIAQ